MSCSSGAVAVNLGAPRGPRERLSGTDCQTEYTTNYEVVCAMAKAAPSKGLAFA